LFNYELNNGQHLSRILEYKFKQITKTGEICAITVEFSELDVMEESEIEMAQCVTNRGILKAFTPLTVTAIVNILNYIADYLKSQMECTFPYQQLCVIFNVHQ
jgi:hypothetical protein